MKSKYQIDDPVKVDGHENDYIIDSILITRHEVRYNLVPRHAKKKKYESFFLNDVAEDKITRKVRNYKRTPYQSPRGDIRCNLTGDQN